jgi:Holliday junction resolvase
MVNKKYVKGRAFEYKVKKIYESNGYLVFRTAGSHSVADLIAIPKIGNTQEWNPILIQCKATIGQTYPKECDVLINVAEKYGCRARLITKNKVMILVK